MTLLTSLGRISPHRAINFRRTLLTIRCRPYSTPQARNTVLHIPKSNVYRFGDSNTAAPVFRDLEWTVKEGESWAVIGSGSGEKTALFQMLLGHLRISPPPPPPEGLFPFLSLSVPPRDPHTCISIVSFGNRRRASGGAFYDYTARYGAVREEDRITLRESMFPETQSYLDPAAISEILGNAGGDKEKDMKFFEELAEKVGLTSLLDLPLVALSNGQTRRARIVKAILSKPELLLLDEPLTGLDVQSRPALLSVLQSLHAARSPRVVIGLRTQDPVPEWVTHVAVVRAGQVITGTKGEVLAAEARRERENASNSRSSAAQGQGGVAQMETGKVLVDMKDVGVRYSKRTVLKDINWEIREGDRWHLIGANGSGKTTLLSLLTGDHPQSYTQLPPTSHLHLFGRPRARIPTPHLHSLIGVVSPELYDAFPRRPGMTVWDVVGTGFDGVFVPRGEGGVGVGAMSEIGAQERAWRVARCWEVLEALGPAAWARARAEIAGSEMSAGKDGVPDVPTTESFKDRAFVDLPAGAQRMVLLMRALVGRPRLVLLDEVWSGMDEGMVGAARRYLREGGGVGAGQAVVVVTHWEEEVPWGVGEGVKRFVLEGGVGRVVGGK